MTTRFMDLFDNADQASQKKLLDYYDGMSKPYLDGWLRLYRKNARMKGMVPRTRNVVKQIVDKSGMLFNAKAPVPKVYINGTENEAASAACMTILESVGWIEFFNNLDPVVRLLKTVIVLVQYDSDSNELFLTMLNQTNCAVHLDDNRTVDTLIYYTGRDAQTNVDTYSIWTNELVQSLSVSTTIDENGNTVVSGGEQLDDVQPHSYGMIPMAVFYDTNTARDGFWAPYSDDLVQINDIMNLHLTDADYAMQHAMLQTLFTNGIVQGSSMNATSQQMMTNSVFGERQVTTMGEAFIGGPGEVVGVENDGGTALFLDYKGPNPQIQPLDAVIKGWVADYAGDWSVSMTSDQNGVGSADSGFKLMVKEIPNMELRRKRQRMMEAGFKRLYKVLLAISDIYSLGLTPNSELMIEFSKPELPVDEKLSEMVWAMKIKEQRATVIDYFMETLGLDESQAIEKYKKQAEYRKIEAEADGIDTELEVLRQQVMRLTAAGAAQAGGAAVLNAPPATAGGTTPPKAPATPAATKTVTV